MGNHYHQAVETPRGNLVAGMQWLQSTFANRFNNLRANVRTLSCPRVSVSSSRWQTEGMKNLLILNTIPSYSAGGLRSLLGDFLAHQRSAGLSSRTLGDWSDHLARFVAWAEMEGCRCANDLQPAIFEGFARWLCGYRTKRGQPLANSTRRIRLVAVRAFGRWLVRCHHLTTDPSTTMPMPKTEQPLPRQVLSPGEVERVLFQPKPQCRQGLRDRAILETFYSTGIRRAELAHLELVDLDFDRQLMIIRRGKGGKDRVVQIGPRALLWIRRYLQATQAVLGSDGQHRALFLTNRGCGFSVKHLSVLVAGYVRRSGLGKTGSCHLFRHAMATAMLDNDADLRCLQEILGHACIQTTQIYTHVSIRRLQEVHARTHPANAVPTTMETAPGLCS